MVTPTRMDNDNIRNLSQLAFAFLLQTYSKNFKLSHQAMQLLKRTFSLAVTMITKNKNYYHPGLLKTFV